MQHCIEKQDLKRKKRMDTLTQHIYARTKQHLPVDTLHYYCASSEWHITINTRTKRMRVIYHVVAAWHTSCVIIARTSGHTSNRIFTRYVAAGARETHHHRIIFADHRYSAPSAEWNRHHRIPSLQRQSNSIITDHRCRAPLPDFCFYPALRLFAMTPLPSARSGITFGTNIIFLPL